MKDKDAGILGLILLAAALATFGYWWMKPPEPPFPSGQSGTIVRSTSSGMWRLQWGYVDDKVRFLAFVQGVAETPKELIKLTGRLPEGRVTLVVPGHTEVDCPSEFNVFQFVDGRFDRQNIALTVQQARKYCDSKMEHYTIDTLREFLKEK